MYILRIELPVRDFTEWKIDFDSDPVGREKHGVLRYRIATMAGNHNFVCVEMELKTRKEAEQLLADVKDFWVSISDKMVVEPSTDILEVEEIKELRSDETTNLARG